MKNKTPITPLISIIIPTMNRVKLLKETLDSIYKLNYPKKKLEIIIVDNGSTDKTIQMLKNNFKELNLIENSKNIGFAPALNQGIKVSKGKYLLITNDDVQFKKNCLIEMTGLMNMDKRIGIVGPRMYFRKPSDMLALSGFRVNLYLGYHPYDYEGIDTIREMDVATGGCMLVRKGALKKSGLFDEGYFFCGEDYDFCFRMRYVGYKLVYCPSAIVWHEFANTSKKSFNQLFAHFRGKFRFMLTHAHILQLLTFFPVQVLIGPFFSYVQSKKKTPLPILYAVMWNFQNLPSTLRTRQKINNLKRRYLNASLTG